MPPKGPLPEHPTGTKLVRLADIPKRKRLAAARSVLFLAKTEDEALKLMALALEPGDAGGRIAA